MVAKRDYKMISIFEVFAVNRNEEDFLENLFIFKELVNEDVEEKPNPEKEEEERIPALKPLNQYKDRLAPEELAWLKQVLIDELPQVKQVMQAIACLKATNDDNDFVHSLKQVYKRNVKK